MVNSLTNILCSTPKPNKVTDVSNDHPKARLIVSVKPATSSNTFPEIELLGNRAGLEWLAEHILRIARTEEVQHTHLDAEVCAPIYSSPDGWWITISCSERL